MEELNLGPPKTNPSSGREEDLNLGSVDHKSGSLNHQAMLPPQRGWFVIMLLYFKLNIYFQLKQPNVIFSPIENIREQCVFSDMFVFGRHWSLH